MASIHDKPLSKVLEELEREVGVRRSNASVKPFGCMPSAGVSDGVQSLITEKYPGTIFCAVETSGGA